MVDMEKVRREAIDCRYTHMVMDPVDVLWLCNEIKRLRGENTGDGGAGTVTDVAGSSNDVQQSSSDATQSSVDVPISVANDASVDSGDEPTTTDVESGQNGPSEEETT